MGHVGAGSLTDAGPLQSPSATTRKLSLQVPDPEPALAVETDDAGVDTHSRPTSANTSRTRKGVLLVLPPVTPPPVPEAAAAPPDVAKVSWMRTWASHSSRVTITKGTTTWVLHVTEHTIQATKPPLTQREENAPQAATCIHTYKHTCIHTYIHACMHKNKHACINTNMHTDIQRCPSPASLHRRCNGHEAKVRHGYLDGVHSR